MKLGNKKVPDKYKTYLIGAAAGVAGVILFRLIFRGAKEAAERLNEITGATYRPQWYIVAADRLEAAMFDLGTDEEAIYGVFDELQNDADFIKLFNAFGMRTYSGGLTPWLVLNLTEWLTQELNQDEIEVINTTMATKDITFRL
jgi:hypothetical protein